MDRQRAYGGERPTSREGKDRKPFFFGSSVPDIRSHRVKDRQEAIELFGFQLGENDGFFLCVRARGRGESESSK